MPILDGFICHACDIDMDGWRDEPWPNCPRCELPMSRNLQINTFEWGGPRTIREVRDEPFTSRSEFRRYMRDRNLVETGDKVHGARNEDHRNLGKLFSYKGAPSKRSELF